MPSAWSWYAVPPEWPAVLQRLEQLERRCRELETRLIQLQSEWNDMKSNPPVHVEYHFDQLKVSRLEGTLHIGMSPKGESSVDAFELGPDGPPGAVGAAKAAGTAGEGDAGEEDREDDDEDGRIRHLQQEMSAYMDAQAPALLLQLCEKAGLQFDEKHRRLIVADVKHQVGPRVHYYCKTTPLPAGASAEQRAQWARLVLDKTKRDVQAAFEAYLRRPQPPAPKGGSEL